MSNVATELTRIEHTLGSSLAEAFRAATEIPEGGGSSARWQGLCTNVGVALLSDAERADIVRIQKPLRGAPTTEFREVVKAIVRRTVLELGEIRTAAMHHDVDDRWSKLRYALDDAEKDMMDTFMKAVLPPPPKGGMFARLTPGQNPVGTFGPSASTLLCTSCGAPQSKPQDLRCRYCGGTVG